MFISIWFITYVDKVVIVWLYYGVYEGKKEGGK